MARRYVARDPRTWKKIGSSTASVDVNIQGLLPEDGPWQRIPKHEIIPLAKGDVSSVQVSRGKGGSFAVRIDGILALHMALEGRLDEAHEVMLDCLDDDEEEIRVAALRGLPLLALKRHDGLLQCLSDRLLDEHPQVCRAARECLALVAPVFPSGCEEILRRELRRPENNHRKNAFEALKLTAENWPEAGCLHLDELIREDDTDLRRRGSKILKVVATRHGSTGWDLVGWSLEDEDSQVRRNASRTLLQLANAEPAIATILIEAAMQDDDSGVRKSVIRALKRLDMRNPRVSKMIIDGARSRDYNLRKACIEHLSVIMTGGDLRTAAAELLRQETRPDLRRRLSSLARDVEIVGTEEEKNRFLAPLDKIESEEVEQPPRSGEAPVRREHDKQKSGRPHSED